MKKQFFLVLDVETANSTEDALVYDLGLAVIDRLGHIYEAHSLVIADIFLDERELMKTAYYAEKLPQYYEGLRNGAWRLVTFKTAYRLVRDVMKRYGITKVCAYNANFDLTALNTTLRFLTSSKYRYFFPYGTEIVDIWHIACQLICSQKRYIKWALRNGKTSPSGNLFTSAEAVYAYLTKEANYEECHTGLQDVYIEAKILVKCFDQHKKFNPSINRGCWRIPQKIRKEMGL